MLNIRIITSFLKNFLEVFIMKNKYTKKSLSVRTTTEMDKMLKYLEGKLLLNPTAIMRLGLSSLHM